MVGDLPPAPGERPSSGPPSSPQWAPPFPTQPPQRPRAWSAIALATVAILLGAAALVVALTRPGGSQSGLSATTSKAPAFTQEQTTAAHKQLCDAYNMAARAVQIETNGKNSDRANLATVNGAVMLEDAVNGNPAITPGDRAAALALAESYSNVAATSSLATGSDDPAWQSALSNANAKDAAMQKICGGG